MTPEFSEEDSQWPECGGWNGLTCRHACIHYVATQDEVEVEPENEIDRFMIDNFLEVLSEVVIAVAARDSEAKHQDERD